MTSAQFSFEEVPLQSKCPWFIRLGATTKFNCGFRSQDDADRWINVLGHLLNWKVGHVIRLRGVVEDLAIVNRRGEVSEP